MVNTLSAADTVQNNMPRISPTVTSHHSPPLKSTTMNQRLSSGSTYLEYSPKPSLHGDSKNYCYRTYLDRLGFDTWDDPVALETRLQFIRDLKAHVCVPETTYLRKEDNPAAFNALVFGFFEKHGDRYWGMERGHLAEKDPLKGFLYPRDALRENSRLVSVLEDIFIYKAKCSRHNDLNRPLERQVIPYINFAGLSPFEINSIGKDSADTNIEGSLRELQRVSNQERERSFEFLIESGPSDGSEKESNSTTDTVSQNEQPRRRVLPLRSTRSKRSHDIALFLQVAEEAEQDLHRDKSKQQQPSTNNGESAINLSLLTGKASARKSAAFKTPAIKPQRTTKRPLIPPGAKRQNPLEAIESVRKRMRLEPISPVTKVPHATPSTTPRNSKNKKANGAPGLFTASMTGNGGRHSNRILATAENEDQDDTITILSDDHQSAEVIFQSSQCVVGSRSVLDQASKTETVKVKTEHLSSEIMSKTILSVTATSQQDMGPVTVKLECFTGFPSFFDFLAEECILNDLTDEITAITATYTWSGRKHRFRKERFDVDWEAFCAELKDAFGKNPAFARQGCNVDMLLHVAA